MANAKLGTKAVGSIVKLKVNGTAKEFIVVHQGKPSSLYDDSCNGTWLLMKDIYESRPWHSSNTNYLEYSTIHSYLNSTFLNLFDSDIRDAIKQVKIPYRKNGGSSGTDQNGANGLPAKIFLLSGYEVGWTTSDNQYFPVDGAKLSYFEPGAGSSALYKRVANLDGSAFFWWLRSPYQSGNVWRVSPNGHYDSSNASYSNGIRPALILPPDMEVDSSGNVTPPPPATHKTLVNGTAYEVQGGKCLVNGTVYSIKKGRTLIGGTGYDITFPSAVTMPVKGDLITMNLDGTDRLYRVLKIVDGTTAEVLGMWNLGVTRQFHSSSNNYARSLLRTYLNTTWYGTLSDTAKAAIVPKTIVQDSWDFGTTGSPQYSGTCGTSVPGSNSYTISLVNANFATVGTDYVYALSVQEVLDYLSDSSVLVDTSAMLRNQNLWAMFWNQASSASEYLWLRSARSGGATLAVHVRGDNGGLFSSKVNISRAFHPAFQIDLSKIDFTIN